VAIVNETLARFLWNSTRNVVGKTIRIPGLEGRTTSWSIIGIASDIRDSGGIEAPRPTLYISFPQVQLNPWHWADQSLYLLARVKDSRIDGRRLLRSTLSDLDYQLPLGDVQTMEDRLSAALANSRYYMFLLVVLAATALLLTVGGIYGVVRYVVTLQRAEIGIRMALGASPLSALLDVVQRGMRPVLYGIMIGTLGARLLINFAASRIAGIELMDAATVSLVAVTVILAGALACYLPAREIIRIDPMIALRAA
jgi:hypothetical protein